MFGSGSKVNGRSNQSRIYWRKVILQSASPVFGAEAAPVTVLAVRLKVSTTRRRSSPPRSKRPHAAVDGRTPPRKPASGRQMPERVGLGTLSLPPAAVRWRRQFAGVSRRQLGRLVRQAMPQPRPAQQLGRPLAGFRDYAADHQRYGDVLQGGELRQQVVELVTKPSARFAQQPRAVSFSAEIRRRARRCPREGVQPPSMFSKVLCPNRSSTIATRPQAAGSTHAGTAPATDCGPSS